MAARSKLLPCHCSTLPRNYAKLSSNPATVPSVPLFARGSAAYSRLRTRTFVPGTHAIQRQFVVAWRACDDGRHVLAVAVHRPVLLGAVLVDVAWPVGWRIGANERLFSSSPPCAGFTWRRDGFHQRVFCRSMARNRMVPRSVSVGSLMSITHELCSSHSFALLVPLLVASESFLSCALLVHPFFSLICITHAPCSSHSFALLAAS